MAAGCANPRRRDEFDRSRLGRQREWLVFGGFGLLAAFPLAFAIIIPAVYFPILVMLFAALPFEFRLKNPALRRFWDGAFCGGSTVATFAHGIVLGTFIQGFKVDGRQFAGTSFDWLSPFPLATGVALIFGSSLLGTGWLVLKTDGDLQAGPISACCRRFRSRPQSSRCRNGTR
jgi:cytochrome bd ubiquinol oxidase subunit II